MKILYIANMRVPTEKAHGYQIFQMAQAFEENGHSVRLVVPNIAPGTSNSNKEDLKVFYNLRTLSEVKKLPSLDFVRITAWTVPYTLKVQFIGNILQILTFTFSLWAYLFTNKESYDMIYLRDPNLAKLIGPLSKSLKLNVWLELHHIPQTPWKRARYRNIIAGLNGVIFLNDSMRKKLYGENKVPIPYQVAHDAVDVESFKTQMIQEEVREYIGFPQSVKIGIFVGRFHTNGMEKGIPEIIESSKDVLEKHPQFKYCFVGGPMDRVGSYQELIESKGLPSENFIFKDKVPVRDVPKYLVASDILLMPFPDLFHYRYCMSPLKLFEYMTARRAIVGTTLPTVQEVLSHGETALLGKPGDSSDIATNIIALLEDKDLRERIANNAYSLVEKYSWNSRSISIVSKFLESLS